MSPAEVASAVRLRLAAELSDDRATLLTLADELARLHEPAADARDEWMRAAALAFQIERYYTAVEALLTRVLRQIDGDVPAGPASHQEVLRAASVALEGGRPAIVSPEAAVELRELLKFHHLARHGYEARPELSRLCELATRAGCAHGLVEASLGAFERGCVGLCLPP
jgi:hypothetical protein